MWHDCIPGESCGNNEKDKNRAGLGSGAARGWSHIGVINALKKWVLKLISLQDVQLVRWWARLCMRSIICAGRLGNLFQLLGVLRLMDLSWQRGGLLRGERVSINTAR